VEFLPELYELFVALACFLNAMPINIKSAESFFGGSEWNQVSEFLKTDDSLRFVAGLAQQAFGSSRIPSGGARVAGSPQRSWPRSHLFKIKSSEIADPPGGSLTIFIAASRL
jgi:hypothetical protein